MCALALGTVVHRMHSSTKGGGGHAVILEMEKNDNGTSQQIPGMLW